MFEPFINYKTISKGDYTYALVPEHPNSTKNGYVLEHRVVVENKLGRHLTSEEIVHHINEDKKDNSVENLIVLSVSEHNKLHNKGELYVELICPECLEKFVRQKRQTYLAKPKSKFTFCSRRCNGVFGSKLKKGYEFQTGLEMLFVREFRIKP